jgi:hypothetical protein
VPDFSNNVKTVYKADTSQARIAVQQLKGVERERAREVLNDLNAHNAKLESQLATWGKVAAGVAAVTGVVVLAKRAMDDYLEDVRLESAAAGANLNALKDATSGLVEADKLLEFAGKTMHGTWKLNNEEMTRVLHGAMALRAQFGGQLEPTIEKLTESITKGSTRALKEFGIEAKDKEGVLRELDAAWKSMGGSAGLAGDDILRAQTSMKDATDDLSGAFGELVASLGPVIEKLAQATGLITKSVEGWKILFRGGDEYLLGDMGFTARKDAMVDQAVAAVDAQMAAADKRVKEILAKRATAPFDALAKEASDAAIKASRARGGGRRGQGDDYAGPALDFDMAAALGGARSAAGRLASSTFGVWSAENDKALEKAREASDVARILREDAERLAEIPEGESLFDDIFGDSSEMNEHALAVEALASSFNVLTGAAGAAYDALISGSGDASEAFRKFLADGIASMGKDFFVRGLGESAHAIAAYASGFIPKAAGHAKAAAAYFAGATVAGITANALGYGSGGGSSSGGGAGSAGGGRGDVTRQSTRDGENAGPVNIYVGSEWEGLSAMERASAINRALRLGKRGASHIRRGG